MITLDNGTLHLELDDRARVTHLENRAAGTGNVIARPATLFRAAILRTRDAVGLGDNLENMAFADEQALAVRAENGGAVITAGPLVTAMGEQAVFLTLTVALSGDRILFGGEIRNESESVVDELIYPCLGALETLDGAAPDWLLPEQCGVRYRDICAYLAAEIGRENLYEKKETYPGELSMSWMALTGGRDVLSFSAHDPLFHAMSLRARGSATGGVTLEADKMCFVEPNQTWTIPEYDARLYRGAWREAADDYVRWAKTWRRPIEPTEWMKRSNGYFLVINKQQYGAEAWPYDTLGELYERAVSHGCDTVGLFGWYHTGHDNNYPDLAVSPTLGGADGLKAGIRAVQAAGGHVTLYYQGHLIDPASPFYRREGAQWEGKNVWGTPYYEFYPKACYSDFLRFFSNKAFSTVCPSAPAWHEMMADRLDWISGFGADGALYDQIGGMPPRPCFNKAHPHKNGNPALSYTQGRLRLLSKIRDRAASHADFVFMSEHITDLYSQFLDCIHGVRTEPAARGKTAVGREVMPELFRYCFPETMITVRNAQPFMDARLVNYALLYGFKFEMELRYDTDKRFIRAGGDEEKRVYAKRIADMRRSYEKWLLLGEFRADEGIEAVNVQASVFRAADGSRAVVMWNDTDAEITPVLRLTDGKIARWAMPDGEGDGLPARLAPNGVAVLLAE